MTSCPECDSTDLENLRTQERERQDDEHETTVTRYKCNECGCEFEVTERYEVETEVTAHGRMFEP